MKFPFDSKTPAEVNDSDSENEYDQENDPDRLLFRQDDEYNHSNRGNIPQFNVQPNVGDFSYPLLQPILNLNFAANGISESVLGRVNVLDIHSPAPFFPYNESGDSDKENSGDSPGHRTPSTPRSPLTPMQVEVTESTDSEDGNNFVVYHKWFRPGRITVDTDDESDYSSDEDDDEPERMTPIRSDLIYLKRANWWNRLNHNVDEATKFPVIATKNLVSFLSRYVLTSMKPDVPQHRDYDEFEALCKAQSKAKKK
ncbi:DgyrCDS9403 [Dimorphilus gyrociliatus]|uniref:DgyrCDS9403 n=1 Tax=Dimorphilus gyrociliatus TaxID=2664684 RepID=A0A7I8VX85_9ANNE|nr:DgyrCDS9403 [Dimorphilus gyrociliatus]